MTLTERDAAERLTTQRREAERARRGLRVAAPRLRRLENHDRKRG